MAHCIVPAAEKILDKPFKVLNKGFVRLVDYLGSDERIVASARVSYAKGTKTFREDAALIDYLLRNDHTSPFEQVVFTFHVKMPIFVARQWIRHRTARVNEISGRYSVMKNEFYLPHKSDVAFQSTDNKQARSKEAVPAALQKKVLELLKNDQEAVYKSYEEMLKHNIARELARVNLPLSLYTEMYWQIDLHNLLHFLGQRLGAHAQKEIRVYAEVMSEIVKLVCPAAHASFQNHQVGNVNFSASEMDALRNYITAQKLPEDEKVRKRFLSKLGLPLSA